MVASRVLGMVATVACVTAVACSDEDNGEGAGVGGATSSAATGGANAGGSTGAGGDSGGAAPTPLEGYWVWTKQIENGQVVLEITDADMEPKVGSAGWRGCPDGILCTRYGIQKVAFGQTGRLHYQHNVFTSSDFQTLGTWAEGNDGHGTFERQEQFSCAHPEQVNADVVPGGFRYEMVDGELRLGVGDFGSFSLYDDAAEPMRWIAFKAVTRDDYYGKYMIRVCQAHDGFECHMACFDESLVDEP